MHSVHPGLPGRCNRRGAEADAHGRDRALFGLRPVRCALPRGLHRHGARVGRRCDLGPGPGARRPRALRAAPVAARARAPGKRRAPDGAGAQGERRSRRGEKARDHPGRDRTRTGAKARDVNPQKRRQIFPRLRAANPHPTTELEYRTPFELLVAVVLSAQATDKSVNLATRRLFAQANTPAAIAALGEEGLIAFIASIGLFRTKAKNVVRLAQIIRDQHGGAVPHDRAALEALPGVGRKTANVVLNTAFGEATIAVDTHIFRVANRTGIAPGQDVDEVERKL